MSIGPLRSEMPPDGVPDGSFKFLRSDLITAIPEMLSFLNSVNEGLILVITDNADRAGDFMSQITKTLKPMLGFLHSRFYQDFIHISTLKRLSCRIVGDDPDTAYFIKGYAAKNMLLVVDERSSFIPEVNETIDHYKALAVLYSPNAVQSSDGASPNLTPDQIDWMIYMIQREGFERDTASAVLGMMVKMLARGQIQIRSTQNVDIQEAKWAMPVTGHGCPVAETVPPSTHVEIGQE